MPETTIKQKVRRSINLAILRYLPPCKEIVKIVSASFDRRLTFREKSKVFETRNLIRFKDYQKYGTDVKIVDDDNEPIPEEKPNQ